MYTYPMADIYFDDENSSTYSETEPFIPAQIAQEAINSDPDRTLFHTIKKNLAITAAASNAVLSRTITPSHLTAIWGGLAGFMPQFIEPISWWLFGGEEALQGIYKICKSPLLTKKTKLDLEAVKNVLKLLLQVTPNVAGASGATLLATGTAAGAPYCFALAFTSIFILNLASFRAIINNDTLTPRQKHEQIVLKCVDCACVTIMDLGVFFGLGIFDAHQKILVAAFIASGFSTTIKMYEGIKILINEKVWPTAKYTANKIYPNVSYTDEEAGTTTQRRRLWCNVQ